MTLRSVALARCWSTGVAFSPGGETIYSASRDGTVVLPAELQIVCQMVQRWELFDAKEYPGKRRLMQAYLRNSEIANTANSINSILLE